VVVAVVALLTAAAGCGRLGAGDGSASGDPIPSGHFVLLPDEPSGADRRGVLLLEARTNLPNGTRVDIGVGGPDIEGTSTGHRVRDGIIEVRVAMNACRMGDGALRAPPIGVILSVAPFNTFAYPSGRGPRTSLPPKQPAEVRAILGERFERLEGNQVQREERGNFILVKKTYRFPPASCTHFLVDMAGGGLRQIPLRPPLEGVEQALPRCPDVTAALPTEEANTEEAATIALRFDASIFVDDGEYRELVDPVVRFPSDWFPARGQEPGLEDVAFIAGVPATSGEAVQRSCGSDVAEKTWQVVLGDAEYGLALVSYYLVLRPDGWRVWGTLEGHGEMEPTY
jgi:hypothetical protein